MSGTGYQMSHDVAVDFIETADIGGTNAATDWVPMTDFDRIYAKVILGTWNATDDLDECRLEQATDSSGSGAKDLTTDASAGNYDTANPIDADGNTVVLEARASDMDAEGGFTHVRLYVAEGGNTGTDNVTGVLIRYHARYKRAQLEAAASTGAVVYVTPS
jgi:hypothetical protein